MFNWISSVGISSIAMDHHHRQKQKQKQFSSKSVAVVLAIFTGVIVLLMPSAPVLVFVFAANIDGTSGDDTLNGTDEADTINGFEGNDLIFGEAGDDILDGSKGDDEIRGGDGNDEIKDENGDPLTAPIDYYNKVYGGSGNDNIDVGIDYTRSDFYYVYGEDGSDYIEVVSNAFIRSGPDDDTIYCTAGNECDVNGEGGDDEIHLDVRDVGSHAGGGSGNDKLFGKGDSVGGDEGNDYLSLDSAPYLEGGEGDDILEVLSSGEFYKGGPGADTFKCSPGPSDIVEDFNYEEGDTASADCETVEDATPPEVELTKAATVDNKGKEVVISDSGATKSRSIKITFEATAGEVGEIDRIECSLDGQAFTSSCTSPVVYDKLSRGTHEFTVRAWDPIGRFGEAEFTWTIGKAAPPTPRR